MWGGHRGPPVSRRLTHRGLRITPPQCLLCRRSEGRRPSGSPLGNPDGSPDPSAGDVVGGSCGCGACLRCEGCIGANGKRPVGRAGRQGTPASGSSPRRLVASSPRRLVAPDPSTRDVIGLRMHRSAPPLRGVHDGSSARAVGSAWSFVRYPRLPSAPRLPATPPQSPLGPPQACPSLPPRTRGQAWAGEMRWSAVRAAAAHASVAIHASRHAHTGGWLPLVVSGHDATLLHDKRPHPCGCGVCLRCAGCMTAAAHGRLAAHGHLLVASSPRRLVASSPQTPPQVRWAAVLAAARIASGCIPPMCGAGRSERAPPLGLPAGAP
jgi:hypothetical protein